MKKRIFINTSNNYKSPKEYTLETLMTMIVISGHIATYIQAFKIFLIKSACAISFLAYGFMLFSCLCWLCYGIIKKIKPLIIPNVFGIIGILLVLFGIIKYDN